MQLEMPRPALHNLSMQLTSFIGRERELVEARHLLSHTRLLTFTGPGGTGKTRLAIHLAADDQSFGVQLANKPVRSVQP